jgi:hypothetical protein
VSWLCRPASSSTNSESIKRSKLWSRLEVTP